LPAILTSEYSSNPSRGSRTQADRLLGPEVTDVDGNAEYRRDTVSVFNGPPPVIRVLASEAEEIKVVGDCWPMLFIGNSPRARNACSSTEIVSVNENPRPWRRCRRPNEE
jgi:hypothetical protein